MNFVSALISRLDESVFQMQLSIVYRKGGSSVQTLGLSSA